MCMWINFTFWGNPMTRFARGGRIFLCESVVFSCGFFYFPQFAFRDFFDPFFESGDTYHTNLRKNQETFLITKRYWIVPWSFFGFWSGGYNETIISWNFLYDQNWSSVFFSFSIYFISDIDTHSAPPEFSFFYWSSRNLLSVRSFLIELLGIEKLFLFVPDVETGSLHICRNYWAMMCEREWRRVERGVDIEG